LNQELLVAHESTDAVNRKLSSKVAVVDELSVWEQATQDALQALAEEKRLLEKEAGSTRKMFTKQYYSSLEVISLAVAHMVTMPKSHMPYLDLELLCKEYRCKDDDERDALVEGVFDTA
jgi:hypothetical protein